MTTVADPNWIRKMRVNATGYPTRYQARWNFENFNDTTLVCRWPNMPAEAVNKALRVDSVIILYIGAAAGPTYYITVHDGQTTSAYYSPVGQHITTSTLDIETFYGNLAILCPASINNSSGLFRVIPSGYAATDDLYVYATWSLYEQFYGDTTFEDSNPPTAQRVDATLEGYNWPLKRRY